PVFIALQGDFANPLIPKTQGVGPVRRRQGAPVLEVRAHVGPEAMVVELGLDPEDRVLPVELGPKDLVHAGEGEVESDDQDEDDEEQGGNRMSLEDGTPTLDHEAKA